MKNFGEVSVENAEKKEGIPQEMIDRVFLSLADHGENESERGFFDDLVRQVCKSKGLPSGQFEHTQMGYALKPDQPNAHKIINIDIFAENIDGKTGEYWIQVDAYNDARSATSLIHETFAFKASAEAVAIHAARQAAKEERWRKEDEADDALREKYLPILCQFAREHKNETLAPKELEEVRQAMIEFLEWGLNPEDSVTFKWSEDHKAWNFIWNRGGVVRDISEFADIGSE